MLPSGINQPLWKYGGVFHPLESLPVLVKLRDSYSHVIYMLFLKRWSSFSELTMSLPIE